MRMPISEIHRAFPELDRFTDAECQRFIAGAVRHRPVEHVAVALGAVVAALAVACVLIAATAFLGAAPLRVLEQRRGFSYETAVGVMFAVPALVGGIVGYIIRDCWLGRIIRIQLRGTGCPGCGYSMLGLAAPEGAALCPECGHLFVLADHDMTAADLIVRADAASV
jgi:hypothetical protein